MNGKFQGLDLLNDNNKPEISQLVAQWIPDVVVDAVVRHWVSVMVEGAEERGERGQEGRHQNALFYADDGMVASSDCDVSRVHLVPWSACSIGWASGPMSGRQSEWSAAHARRRGPIRRWRTSGG